MLGRIAGKNVLCLAGDDYQQSAAFALLGANPEYKIGRSVAINYSTLVPASGQYTYCPKCRSELVGIVDEEKIPRAKCPDCGWTYFPCNVQSVNILIVTPEGLVFLFPPGEPTECPAAIPGGVVEYGETPEQAAVREAQEETGLEVEVVRELKRIFYPDFPFGPSLSFILETHSISGTLRAGLEGRVAIHKEGDFPAISRHRKGSRKALMAYLEAKDGTASQSHLTVIEHWRD